MHNGMIESGEQADAGEMVQSRETRRFVCMPVNEVQHVDLIQGADMLGGVRRLEARVRNRTFRM
jgi:hypothetical protein